MIRDTQICSSNISGNLLVLLQGSTYKRKASKAERAKDTPTLKDLDFLNDHPEVRCAITVLQPAP